MNGRLKNRTGYWPRKGRGEKIEDTVDRNRKIESKESEKLTGKRQILWKLEFLSCENAWLVFFFFFLYFLYFSEEVYDRRKLLRTLRN